MFSKKKVKNPNIFLQNILDYANVSFFRKYTYRIWPIVFSSYTHTHAHKINVQLVLNVTVPLLPP